jgi:phosphatidylserine decarboxylase
MKHLFVFLQRVLPQHLLSRLVGTVARSQLALIRRPFIWIFIKAFEVDVSEAERDPSTYVCFNEFFTRALKPGVRPVSGKLCSPADGTVSAATDIEGNQLIQAKGLTYSLEKLLATPDVEHFRNGSFTTIYLSPKDYHRVHVPVSGRLMRTQYVPVKLFSVNQTTTGLVPDLFSDNERLVLWFESDDGPYCLIMVGAMIVAGIRTVWHDGTYPPRVEDHESFTPPRQFDQGEELGCFEMGSTVILVFPSSIDWQVKPGDPVKMGCRLS